MVQKHRESIVSHCREIQQCTQYYHRDVAVDLHGFWQDVAAWNIGYTFLFPDIGTGADASDPHLPEMYLHPGILPAHMTNLSLRPAGRCPGDQVFDRCTGIPSTVNAVSAVNGSRRLPAAVYDPCATPCRICLEEDI